MSRPKDETPPQESPAAPGRREFLGKTAAAAAVVAGVPSLLAACSDSGTGAEPEAARPAAPGAPSNSLGGGPNFGNTVHKMVAGTIGSAPDIKIPALEKGVSTTYLQRIITDSDRTGTGLATVLKGTLKSADGRTTVQVAVQDSRGRTWPARSIVKQSDLVYAMKDALATNPHVDGVLRESLNAGNAIVAISKSHIIQFPDSVASDYYGNHLDIHSRGLCDLFNNSVGGYPIASTTRDFSRC